MFVAPRSRLTRRALFGALLSLTPGVVVAQASRVAPVSVPPSTPRIEAAYVNVPIRLDGRLDEPVWRAVKPSNQFVQREPVEGAPATHATDVRMLITDDAVVIGARLRDDRAGVFGSFAPPADGANGGYLSDFFEVQIDPHRDHVTAFALSVSPSGSRRSWIVTRDGARDASWDLHWEARTHADNDGWTVEIRIPLAEFHVKPGTEAWGVQFTRFSWRRQETDVLQFLPSAVTSAVPVQRP
jgi:hypothetical protein